MPLYHKAATVLVLALMAAARANNRDYKCVMATTAITSLHKIHECSNDMFIEMYSSEICKKQTIYL